MEMSTTTKRRGRPLKPPQKGKRVSVTVMIDPKLKQRIAADMRDSGRSQSQQIEMLLERCLTYDRMLSAMRTTVADIEQGNVEEALRRRGWTSMHTTQGK